MSIFIKGLDMPKSCWDCGIGTCICNRYRDPKFTRGLSERHPDCPLVEVRVPHGRLTDVDAIDTSYSDPEVVETLREAPTIIEPEE